MTYYQRLAELNPVAQWVFVRWNVAGLTVYKFSMVGLIVVLGETIERHRPGVGRATGKARMNDIISPFVRALEKYSPMRKRISD